MEWLWPSSIISDRVRKSVPPPPILSSSFILTSYPVLNVHHLFPWYPSIAHIVATLCSSALIYFNLLPSNFFSPYFFLSVSYLRRYVEEASAVLVLNSLFGFHLSNKLEDWIIFSSSWYQRNIKTHSHSPYSNKHTHTHRDTHKHSASLSCTGWKMDRCLSGETSPGKCFSSQKSPGYHYNLRLLRLRWEEDVISLPNDQPLGLPHHFVIWKLISL